MPDSRFALSRLVSGAQAQTIFQIQLFTMFLSLKFQNVIPNPSEAIYTLKIEKPLNLNNFQNFMEVN